MIFKQVEIGPMQNFCYIVGDETEVAVVDPGFDAKKIKQAVGNRTLKKVILTHSHFDHTGAIIKLRHHFNFEIYAHKAEISGLKEFKKVHRLKDNDIIEVGKVKLKVIHTPGHSKGGICLLVENKLLTGDTLFVEAIGRTDLPESDPKDMEKSLKKIKSLPDDTEVWPGHDYGSKKHSTISYEKQHNPFLNS